VTVAKAKTRVTASVTVANAKTNVARTSTATRDDYSISSRRYGAPSTWPLC
jgi:hypothetical protein